MPAGGWRYIAQRLNGDGSTGDFLDFDVPLQGVAITDQLSGHNALSATIAPQYARLLADDGAPLFDEWGTAIWAENQGEIRGGGILVSSGFDGPQWNLTCTGYTGYLDGMPWVSDLAGNWFGVEVDPLDVLRKLWSHAQSKPGGNLGLEISPLKTGLKIGTKLKQGEFDTVNGPLTFESGPVQLTNYGTTDLGQEATKLASETPFDWHERHFWQGDVIRHVLDLGYPRIGQRRPDLRFVVGENVTSIPSIQRDGALYASEVQVFGAGDGPAMKRGVASRPRRNRLRRAVTLQDSSLRSGAACNGVAEREVAWRTGLDDVTDIFVTDSPAAPVGAASVGDEILVQGDCGWRTLETWARIISRTIVPEQGEAVALSIVRSDKLSA